MRNIIIIITLILSFRIISTAQTDVDPYLDSARAEYSANNFENSVRLYMRAIDHGYESPQLYYNIGNGYYKQTKIALAILWYQRALKLDPTYEDAQFNLQMAQQLIVDKIDPITPPFYKRWLQSAILWLTPNGWAIMSVIVFFILAGGLILLFSSAGDAWKRLAVPIVIVTIVLSIITLLFSKLSYNNARDKTIAIVMSPSVTVRSTPHSEGTKLFTIHEGLTVKVNSSVDGWCEIRLTDGRIGWLVKTDIEPV